MRLTKSRLVLYSLNLAFCDGGPETNKDLVNFEDEQMRLRGDDIREEVSDTRSMQHMTMDWETHRLDKARMLKTSRENLKRELMKAINHVSDALTVGGESER